MEDKERGYGQAYAFFDCDANLIELGRSVKSSAETLPRPISSKLELSLKSMPHFRRESNDIELLQFVDSNSIYPIFHSKARNLREEARPINMKDLRYVLSARYKGGTNEDAGKVLGAIMNDVYSEYTDGSFFVGDLVGKGSDGNYSF